MKRFILILACVAAVGVALPARASTTSENNSVATTSVFSLYPCLSSAAAPSNLRYDNPFAWLSYNYLTYDDLVGASAWDLRILRNSIYAMHGYIFKSSDLRSYFSQFAWYKPRYKNVDRYLNKIERANVAFIKRFE